jgi:hypothetical protein
MWANNETGVLFPVERIAEICRSRGVLYHCGAVQAAGKVEIDVRNIPADYLSLAGHKFHAPKGGWRAVRPAQFGPPDMARYPLKVPLDFSLGARQTICNAVFRRWTARKGWRETGPERGLFILQPNLSVTVLH